SVGRLVAHEHEHLAGVLAPGELARGAERALDGLGAAAAATGGDPSRAEEASELLGARREGMREREVVALLALLAVVLEADDAEPRALDLAQDLGGDLGEAVAELVHLDAHAPRGVEDEGRVQGGHELSSSSRYAHT